MERNPTSDFLERIAARLEATGKSERAASIEAFGNPGGIRNARHGLSKAPTIEFFAKLAPVLDVAPEWLAWGANDAQATQGHTILRGPRIVGKVAAGTWRDTEIEDEGEQDGGEIPIAPGFPIEAQYGLEVDGPSINRIALPGDILVCVDIRKIRHRPKPGELVIAQRRRGGGALVETTAKRLHMNDDGSLELRPESTHPSHQKAVPLGTDDGDETVEVEIIGLVQFAIRCTRQSETTSI